MKERTIQNLVNAIFLTVIMMAVVFVRMVCTGEPINGVFIGIVIVVIFISAYFFASFDEKIDAFGKKHKVLYAGLQAFFVTILFGTVRVLNGKMQMKTACITGSIFFIILTIINYTCICRKVSKKNN